MSERLNEGMNLEMEELMYGNVNVGMFEWMNDKIDVNKWKNRRRKNKKY